MDNLTESMTQMMESLSIIVDAVVGHRAKLEAAGFSPTIAEQMAANLHMQIVVRIFGAMI